MKFSNINWNFYKYFAVVYETRSFNKAAEVIGVSPSAVLQNIKELSNQLGTTLFTSSPKGVEPTPEADKMYPQIKSVVEKILEQEDRFETFDKNSNMTIKIAAHSWFAKIFLNGYIKEFRTKYPKAQLTVIASDDAEMLANKKVDFMIDIDCLFEGTNLRTVDIFQKDIETVFVASSNYIKEHGLNKSITKAELIKHPIIERNDKLIKKYKEMLGFDFSSFDIKVQTTEQIVPMIKNSLGITSFGKCFLQELNDPDIVEIEIKDIVIPTVRFVCAYNGTLPRHVRTFINGLLSYCRTPSNQNKVF